MFMLNLTSPENEHERMEEDEAMLILEEPKNPQRYTVQDQTEGEAVGGAHRGGGQGRTY